MSILSDLEPNNARIQYATPARHQRYIGWSIGLALLLGGTGWLYVTATAESAATVHAADGTGMLAPAQQTPPSPSLLTTLTPPTETESKDDGVAIIRSLATAPLAAEPPGTAALSTVNQRDGEQGAAPLSANGSNNEMKQKLSAATGAADRDSATTKPNSTKAKATRTAKAIQRQRQQKNVALATERDIEIISAIVR